MPSGEANQRTTAGTEVFVSAVAHNSPPPTKTAWNICLICRKWHVYLQQFFCDKINEFITLHHTHTHAHAHIHAMLYGTLI